MTKISTLAQAMGQIKQLNSMQAQIAKLQTQLTTQKKGQLFKELGMEALGSQRARANFATLETYISNINHADRRIKMMITSIEEVKQQAGHIASAIQIQTQEGEIELGTITDLADKTFDFITNLLNQQDGDRYLFGGSGVLSQPLTATGTFDSYVQARLTDWVNGDITTTQLINSYRDKDQLTDTIMGYSAQLSSGNSKNVTVRVDKNSELDYTLTANNDALREVMVVVNMMRNLGDVMDQITRGDDDPAGIVTAPGATQEEQNENFYKLYNDLSAMLNKALSKIDTEHFKLAQTQAQMNQIQENHKVDLNTLTGIISDIEDVDINEVALKLSSLQIQLEAAYSVTASVSRLSLVNFI